ncbi:uncharacterized protein LOC112057290 [Bicyclus anynana]|uniref:Uncharacterized protein LOC112057290 n=1 Tax=Bicyclus anynana TaxID=110368 RepID=A0ABM3LR36_BICAN|nr:uncharacterized protein LOC112057290 [Bicyclus anynana]
MPRLCAFGCLPNDVTMHRFPQRAKFPDRFKTWVTLVGGKLETEADFEFYMKKRVCDIHFTDRDKNRNSRLNALAIPTLYLSGRDIGSSSVPHNSSNVETVAVNMDFSLSLDTGRDIRPVSVEPGPSNTVSTVTVINDIGPSSDPGTRQDRLHHPQLADTCWIRMEHNYSVISRQDRVAKGKKVIHKQVPMKPVDSTIRRMRSEISRLRKRSQSFKTRLASAEKISEDVAFTKLIDNMTKPAQLFVQMQIQTNKAYGELRLLNKLTEEHVNPDKINKMKSILQPGEICRKNVDNSST